MKFFNILEKLILCFIIFFISAVGYNVYKIQKLDNKIIENNIFSITIEVATRLGGSRSIGIIGQLFTDNIVYILEDRKVLKEFTNVIYEWYAPIGWSPVLNTSKVIGSLFFKNKFNNK